MPKQNPHRVYLVSILTNGKLTPETCPAFSIKTVAFSLVSKDWVEKNSKKIQIKIVSRSQKRKKTKMLINFLVPYRVASHLLEPPHNVSAWLLEIVILMIVETNFEQQAESAEANAEVNCVKL